MNLTAYALHSMVPELIPAPAERAWMDEFSGRHAYRCLPLAIANCYGWQLLTRNRITVDWDGTPSNPAIAIDGYGAVSNFGRGVVTFDVPYIFRTDPGYHLLVSGPSNSFKDGAAPLQAYIETDWLPYTFTMNWQMTRPGTVVWEAGEAFCQIAVVPANIQEQVEPVIMNTSQVPQIKDELEAWTRERATFMTKFSAGDPATIKQAWQKFYFTGKHPDGTPSAQPHQNKLRLKPFEDKR